FTSSQKISVFISSNQLVHGREVLVEQLDREFRIVADEAFGIDAHSLIERGEDFLELYRAVVRIACIRGGGSDDLPRLESAARAQRTVGLRPVVPAAAAIDLASPAESAAHEHDHIIDQAPLLEVGAE